jgi:mannose-6-phosphate isomerase-like protein (cupin superfamily)
VHANTIEHYIVLSGTGKFILGAGADERIVDVQHGTVVTLPPGQPHGIVSDDPSVPIRALLIFTPGLAPKEEPEFRDEEVIYLRASDRLRAIGEINRR